MFSAAPFQRPPASLATSAKRTWRRDPCRGKDSDLIEPPRHRDYQRPRHLQTEPFCRPGRVASAGGLNASNQHPSQARSSLSDNAERIAHRRRLRNLGRRLKPIYSDNATSRALYLGHRAALTFDIRLDFRAEESVHAVSAMTGISSPLSPPLAFFSRASGGGSAGIVPARHDGGSHAQDLINQAQ